MKKITKICILTIGDVPRFGYIIFNNLEVKYSRYNKKLKNYIDCLKKQEKSTLEELKYNHKISYIPATKKNNKKLTNFAFTGNNYAKINKLENCIAKTSCLFSSLEILTNHFITYNGITNKVFIPLSFVAIELPFLVNHQIKIERKFLPNKVKLHKFMTASVLSLSAASFIDSLNLPSIDTVPYYYEIKHTNIEDTGNYNDLDTNSYHTKAVDTIIDNLHNNPYLTEEDLNILLELKNYYQANKNLDYSKLLQNMLTLRIRNEYNFGDIMGSCISNDNFIYTYPNNYDNQRELVILHEAIHKTGNLENKILDEGMTSLIQREFYPNAGFDGYNREVIITKLFCEIVGSDIMLEAYSTNNMELIEEKLLATYNNKNVIDYIYDLADKYVDNSNGDAYKDLYNLRLVLINEANTSIQNDVYNKIKSFDSEKLYFKK